MSHSQRIVLEVTEEEADSKGFRCRKDRGV
jgi:hypothetical protein